MATQGPAVVERHVKLPADLDAALVALCDEQNILISHAIRLAIARHVADRPHPDSIPGVRIRRPGRPRKKST